MCFGSSGKELSVGNISLVYPKIASFFLFPSQYWTAVDADVGRERLLIGHRRRLLFFFFFFLRFETNTTIITRRKNRQRRHDDKYERDYPYI